MDSKSLLPAIALIAAAFSAQSPAQQVYRCQQADGSTIFSDLPCESDIGQRDTVDATPHQGHRRAGDTTDSDEARNGKLRAVAAAEPGRHRAGPEQDDDAPGLSRKRRLSLERERKALLSGLKRRHVPEVERREMLDALRRIDGELGIGPADVAGMPFHDRDVYEENAVYR